MQIQPVSLSMFGAVQKNNFALKKQNYVNSSYQNNSSDSITFTGYEKFLEEAVNKTYKTDKEVEQVFIKLIDSIAESANINKTDSFEKIYRVYKRSGFRGLLHELWSANPSGKIEKIRMKAELNSMPLAVKNDESIMELFSFGEHGFWNFLFGSKNATHDVKLVFKNEKTDQLIEFGLGKKGNIELCQRANDITTYSAFYKETGNIEHKTVHGYGNPESTYYTKDGQKGGLNQFLYGGVANPNMW